MHDWTRIVAEHGPAVWRTVYRLLGNAADAADCYQDTFLSALRLTRDAPVKNWPALLRRIATARALDALRRRVRHARRQDVNSAWERMPDPAPGPISQAESAELAQRARQALAVLPERQAEVAALRYLDGLSYKDIAACLHLRVGAVSVLLHKARRRMSEALNIEITSDKHEEDRPCPT